MRSWNRKEFENMCYCSWVYLFLSLLGCRSEIAAKGEVRKNTCFHILCSCEVCSPASWLTTPRCERSAIFNPLFSFSKPVCVSLDSLSAFASAQLPAPWVVFSPFLIAKKWKAASLLFCYEISLCRLLFSCFMSFSLISLPGQGNVQMFLHQCVSVCVCVFVCVWKLPEFPR